MEIARLARISGRVTGVGFRYSTYEKARIFPMLKGYVRNAARGEVEVFLQGEAREVEAMLEWIGRGPVTARVDKMEIENVPVDNCRGDFTIL